MKINNKYIGINQRIPFEVFSSAITDYLNNNSVDEARILQHMKEFTKGENRANKAMRYIVNIINRNTEVIDKYRVSTIINGPLQLERKILTLCLICLTYPIAFELIQILAKGFKVQPTLNTQYIILKISAVYGSNRTVRIAIEALIPMLIEIGILKREKMGLYAIDNKLKVSSIFINELVIFTDIKSSGSKSILIEDLTFRPWYSFFELLNIKNVSSSKLLKFRESSVGKGYITISNHE
jgi:hypothetical protein